MTPKHPDTVLSLPPDGKVPVLSTLYPQTPSERKQATRAIVNGLINAG